MPYVRFSPALEAVTDDEGALAEQIIEQMARTNRIRTEKYGHGIRDAHSKGHGYLKGELEIADGLPPHLRQGLFAQHGIYPVAVRLSSAPGAIHSDRIPVAQGMAIKVMGVPGTRLLTEDTGRNQDFLFVNIPVLTFGTARKYKKLLDLLEATIDAPAMVQKAVAGTASLIEAGMNGVGMRPSAMLTGLARNHRHLLGETFHSMAAIRFGEYVAKLSVAPASANLKTLTGKVVRPTTDTALRDLVVEHFSNDGGEYELRAQLCTDLKRMPIEDASVPWPTGLSPHQTVAKLRLPRQKAYTDDRAAYFDDVLAFNPWHGIADHQPLGSINRIRIKAYERSTAFRHNYNGRPRIEPNVLDEIPD